MTNVAYMTPGTTASSSSPLSQEQRFKVLTAEVTHRLSTMNSASRRLRQMGYQVVGEILSGTPTILIERGADGSIARLLDRATKPYWCEKGGVKYGVAIFMGVTVTWREA